MDTALPATRPDAELGVDEADGADSEALPLRETLFERVMGPVVDPEGTVVTLSKRDELRKDDEKERTASLPDGGRDARGCR